MGIFSGSKAQRLQSSKFSNPRKHHNHERWTTIIPDHLQRLSWRGVSFRCSDLISYIRELILRLFIVVTLHQDSRNVPETMTRGKQCQHVVIPFHRPIFGVGPTRAKNIEGRKPPLLDQMLKE
jgi:hypothetical protein